MDILAIRDSASFEKAELDIADFDGTMFNTFEEDATRSIYGVDQAYLIAVEKALFFDSDAIKKYQDQGEHQNRTPAEIVHSLVPNASAAALERLTTELVAAKLDVLENQIGKKLADGAQWPRPMPGFVEYSNAIASVNPNNPVDRAVLSAGHASFIRKCMTMTGIQQPDILITDETIRGLNSPLPPDQLAKPELMPFSLAVLLWHGLYGQLGSQADPEALRQRIKVIGDSEPKDGGLAEKAGVEFFLVTPETSLEAWSRLTAVHNLGAKAIQSA